MAKAARSRKAVLREIGQECKRVDARRKHDPPASPAFWYGVLGQEFGEVGTEVTALTPPTRGRKASPKQYRREMVHVATVAVRAIQAFDRSQQAKPGKAR